MIIIRRRKLLCGLAVTVLCSVHVGHALAQPTSDLTLTSANVELQTAFAEAKTEILSELVVTGQDPDYIPAYWGAYRDREAFYSRDICHQVEAGHLLGLDLENWSMLRTFAQDATVDNGYWPYWSYDFFGEPYYMDAGFKELPAPFEIVHRSYEQYLWTGNTDWLMDSVMFDYYTNICSDFVAMQDVNGNGVAEEAVGLCTYWEQETDDFIEAGDAIGSQYRAYLAYSAVLEARGDQPGAVFYASKADDLRAHFETVWYSPLAERYIRGFREDGTFRDDFGHENSFFIPLKRIGDQAERTTCYLEYIHQNIYEDGINIEAKTYLPEMYYHHGRNALAWHWHLNVIRSGSSYPEVSFLIISNTVAGLMGVRPDAPAQTVFTIPRLVREIPWVDVDHIPFGTNDIRVRHDGLTKTTLTNNSGPDIQWVAEFEGNYDELLLDGVPVPAQSGTLNGRPISSITLSVTEQATRVVEVPPLPDPVSIPLSSLDWSFASAPSTTCKDVNGHGYVLSLASQPYALGLGMVVGNEVRYSLGGAYHLFIAEVGIDDESGNSGTVGFEVWADNTLVFDSGTLSGADPAHRVVVDVEGIDELKLVVSDAGDGGYEYVDWAAARLTTVATPFLALDGLGILADDDGDGYLDPGESATIGFQASNLGVLPSADAILTVASTGPYGSFLTILDPTVPLGILQPGDSLPAQVSVTVDAQTPRGTPLRVTSILSDGTETNELVQTFVTPAPALSLTFEGVTGDDNGDGLLDPGETADLPLTVANTGTGASLPATASCVVTTGSFWVTVLNPTIDLGILDPETTLPIAHNIIIDPATPRGTVIEVEFELSDGLDAVQTSEVFLTPSPAMSVAFVSLTSLGNGQSMVEAGESSELVVEARNSGTGATLPATLEVEATGAQSNLVTIPTATFPLGIMEPGSAINVTIPFEVSQSAEPGTFIELTLTLSDALDSVVWGTHFVVDVLSLSDMNWTYASNGYGEIRRDRSNQGLPLTLEGVTYLKGLGTHAICEIRYDLAGAFSGFMSEIGVDDEIYIGGSVVFQVWLDGALAFDSGVMTGSSPTQTASVDVSGVQELSLLVGDAGNGIAADHSDWAFARLFPDAVPAFSIELIGLDDEGGDGILDAGESADLQVGITNVGFETSDPATVSCTATGPSAEYVTVLTPLVELGVINPGEQVIATHTIAVAADTPAGTLLDLLFEVSDGTYSASSLITVAVATTAPPGGIYLSDMAEVSSQQDWGTLQKDTSVEGNPIVLQGVDYEKGLGTHANSEIIYDLGGDFCRLVSDVGVDDETGDFGSITFEVWADGVNVYDSGPMTGTSPTQTVDVDVTGTNELRLVVTDAGNGISWDHADWAGARLVSSPGDLDCDGDVDFVDLDLFVSVLLQGPPPEHPEYAERADMNGDTFVDGNDIQLFANAILST